MCSWGTCGARRGGCRGAHARAPGCASAHRLLELHRQRGLDGLKEPRRPAVLAGLDVVDEAVLLPGVGPVDRPAARLVGHAVVVEPRVEDQHARRAGAAEKLVRREIDRVEALAGRRGACRSRRRAPTRRSPRSSSPRAVHDPRERVHGRAHAGDVGAGGEGADLQGPLPVAFEQRVGAAGSTRPRSSGGITSTSAMVSSHDVWLEWCSMWVSNTTGRSSSGSWQTAPTAPAAGGRACAGAC